MKFLNPEDYQPKANEVFQLLKHKISTVMPSAQIEHIGSSAIKGAISKGDLDIFVGVSSNEFSQSLDALQSFGFNVKEGTLRTAELCMLECFDYDIDVGIQLVDINSKHINFLTFRDTLLKNPHILNKYNQLKRESIGLSETPYRAKKSDFIVSILEKKGHRARVSVVVLHENKILGFHAEDEYSRKKYFFLPGGLIESGETAQDAAIRETLEETGYKIEIIDGINITRRYDFEWHGVVYDCTTEYFAGRIVSNNATLVNDASYHRGVDWVKMSEIRAVFGYHIDIFEPIELIAKQLSKTV